MKSYFFSLILLLSTLTGFGQSLTENFDDISQLESNGWTMLNLSSPLGVTSWFQGSTTVFHAQNGADNSYIAANFNNTAGSGTISNWLITPTLYVRNGDQLSFWTSTAAGSIYNDRLEVRMSQGIMSLPTTANNVGSFNNVMTIINDDYDLSYPNSWTQFVVTVSGVGSGITPVNFAFRYNVANGGSSGANSNYIGIDRLQVTTSGIYTITTSSAPAAGGTTSGGGVFADGNTASLIATPNEGYIFKNWQENGTVVSTEQNYSFLVNENRNLVAKFTKISNAPTYAIKTKSTPAIGGTTSGDGSYQSNTKATLKAVANPGYKFVNWTIGGTEVSNKATYKHTVTGKATVVANFEALSYAITTKSAPAAGGTTTGAGSYVYNSKATLKAVANPGYKFVNWTIAGTEVSNKATYKHTVTGKATVVANFEALSYVITTKSAPAAGGTTSGGGSYAYNTKATLKAVANAGYTFVNWTIAGVEVSNKATYKHTVTGKATVVANFVSNVYAKENPNDEFSFNFYPNPVKDILYIKTNRNIEAVQAYNLSGQQVMNLKMTEVIRGEINVSRLPSGIYIFKTVLDNGKVESFRVMKK